MLERSWYLWERIKKGVQSEMPAFLNFSFSFFFQLIHNKWWPPTPVFVVHTGSFLIKHMHHFLTEDSFIALPTYTCVICLKILIGRTFYHSENESTKTLIWQDFVLVTPFLKFTEQLDMITQQRNSVQTEVGVGAKWHACNRDGEGQSQPWCAIVFNFTDDPRVYVWENSFTPNYYYLNSKLLKK